MIIFLTDAALSQLEAIHEYIARTSPEYADKVVARLVNRSEQIAAFPRSGRMVPEYEIDEVREVTESSYRLIYLIKEKQVEVLAIVHAARKRLPQD